MTKDLTTSTLNTNRTPDTGHRTPSSRRRFLAQSGSALGATWLAMGLPAVLSSCERAWEQAGSAQEFTTLTPSEALELEAVAARIFPATDTPGAREAGVIHFLDTTFGSVFSQALDPIRGSLKSIAGKVEEKHGAAATFASLSEEDQDEIMEGIASEPYFTLIRFVVICGMFSHPKYGGNRDKVGWELLGFEDQHAWQPPFGHYDAEAHDAE